MSITTAMRDANSGIGISLQSEWKEGPPSWGRDGSNPELQFPNVIGQAPAADNFTNNALVRQARLVQAAQDTAAGGDAVPGWTVGIDVVAGQWCWVYNKSTIAENTDDPIGSADAPLPPAEWSPLELFANGEAGGWWDPTDLTTLFQDAAGTIPVTDVEQPVGLMVDKSGNGNDFTQSTDAARPILRARYNLLTYSEDVSNAAWAASAVTKTANSITASAGVSGIHAISCTVEFHVGGKYTYTADLEYATSRYVSLRIYDSSQFPQVVFDLVDGTIVLQQTGIVANIEDLGGGIFRCTATKTSAATGTGNASIFLQPDDFTAAGNPGAGWTPVGTESVIIHRQQLGIGDSAGPYQFIAAADDYDDDPVNFPPYLWFDGVDDYMTTAGSVDFSGSTAASGFIGATPFKAGNPDVILSLGADYGASGRWVMQTSPRSIARYGSNNAVTSMQSNSTFPSPYILTLTGKHGSVPWLQRRNGIDGAPADSTEVPLANTPLFLAYYSNLTFFQGRLYSAIARGELSSEEEVEQTEQWISFKMPPSF